MTEPNISGDDGDWEKSACEALPTAPGTEVPLKCSWIKHLTWPTSYVIVYCSVTQSGPTLAMPWTVAHEAPLSRGFSKQEYWSGLPSPSPGYLPDPGIEPSSPELQTDSLPLRFWGSPVYIFWFYKHQSDFNFFYINMLLSHSLHQGIFLTCSLGQRAEIRLHLTF